MRRFALLYILLLLPAAAFAGVPEAKELARNYNCQATAVTPISMKTGEDESVTYKVDCALPDTASADDKKTNSTLTIECSGALCTLVKKGDVTSTP